MNQAAVGAPAPACGCKKGMLRRKHRFGLLYQTGTGLARDDARAFELFQASPRRPVTWKVNTQAGHVRLAEEIGYPEEPIAVAAMVCRGRQPGPSGRPQFALGVMLQQGTGGAKNEFAARRWLRQAAAGRNENWRVRRLPIVDQTRKASSLQRDPSRRTTLFWGSVRRYSSRPWPLMRWVPKPRFVMTPDPIP